MSEEKELGKKFVMLIRKSMPLVEDGEVLTYVRNVGNRVAKEVGITTYQFQFFVVDATRSECLRGSRRQYIHLPRA